MGFFRFHFVMCVHRRWISGVAILCREMSVVSGVRVVDVIVLIVLICGKLD